MSIEQGEGWNCPRTEVRGDDWASGDRRRSEEDSGTKLLLHCLGFCGDICLAQRFSLRFQEAVD